MTTIHDVARRAGVSPVTVSRVLNSASNVNAATREKVEQAIRDLGYVPNLAARSLRSRQTSTIALIVPDITNAFWTTVARGIEDAAQAEGYSVLLCNSDENLAKQTGYINAVLQQRVDGVMIAPYDSDPRNLSQMVEHKTPVVVIDRRVDSWEVDTVRTDSISAAYALTQHLISLGHRRIAIISGPPVTSTAEDRVAGYCLALKEAGISTDARLIRRGEYRASSGRALTDQLMDEDLDPTAIIAANNVLTMGALESLQNHGKTVPQDMALVCFDELPDLARFYPLLTVVAQPAYDMGINAAQLLLSQIHSPVPLRPRQVLLPSRLILRYSCGRYLGQPDQEIVNLNPLKDRSETILVKPLSPDQLHSVSSIARDATDGLQVTSPETGRDGPDANRLRAVLAHQKAEALPHIEISITSREVFEYVLGRSLPYSQPASSGKLDLSPAELVEFARRAGLDAIPCEMNWLPGKLELNSRENVSEIVRKTYPPPSLTDYFTRLEGLIRATQSTPVGVFVSVSSFFAPALRMAGVQSGEEFEARRAQCEAVMDLLLVYQEKVLRAVCDRFARDLLLLMIRDDLSALPGQPFNFIQELVLPRLSRLVAPAREHNLITGISMPGAVWEWLPALHKAGFGLVHGLDPDLNDLSVIYQRWSDQLVLAGGFPTRLLVRGTPAQIEEKVMEMAQIATNGSFVAGTSEGITEAVRPENFMTLMRAVRRCKG